MSTFDDPNDLDIDDPANQEPNAVRQMRERIKHLEGEVKAKADLEARLATMERTETIRTAGLDLDDVRRKALEAAHSGEWTPEGVRATAVALGWAEPPKPDVPDEEVAGHQRLAEAYTGASTGAPNPDADLDARLEATQSEREFLELYRSSGRPMSQ